MAEKVTSKYRLELQISEVGDAADYPASTNETDRTIKHNSLDVQGTLVTAGTIAPEAVVSEAVTATKTVDLTAAPKGGGATQDLTGGKLLQFIFEAPADNAAAVTIGPGATDAYTFLGLAAGDTLSLQPGTTLAFTHVDTALAVATTAVAGSVKNIDITITGSDALNYTITTGNS